jgi:VWFA-related protein
MIRITAKTILILCIVLTLNLFSIASQEEKPQYKVEVKEKLLYVLALDKNGNPVTDLKKEDFQLLVNSKLQEIETFSLISHIPDKTRAEKAEAYEDKVDMPSELINESQANNRFILAVLPPVYSSFRQRWMAKKSLIHLIEKARFHEDWIAIVAHYGDWIYTLQDFTNSKEKLLQKIDAFFKVNGKEISILQRYLPTTGEEISQVPQLPLFQGVMPVKGIRNFIPGLELIAEKMSVLKGRKIVICLALPISCFPGETAYSNMINRMLANNITIYYSELRGPGIFAMGSYKAFSRESSHFALANETGGNYYYNSSSPKYFIEDIEKMNSSYYLISFPIEERLGEITSYDIQLQCRRKGVKLHYSNKYYAPHDIEDQELKKSNQRIQLYNNLFNDTKKKPALTLYGQWIPIPSGDELLPLGAIDFYLPAELFHMLSKSYELSCFYSYEQEDYLILQEKVHFDFNKKAWSNNSLRYVLRLITILPPGKKTLKQTIMDYETGEYGRFDITINEGSSHSNFSELMLGRLLHDGLYYDDYKEESEDHFSLKKYLYDLLSIGDNKIIPSADNSFNSGEHITFCLLHKIPEEQSERFKNVKILAYLSLDKEGQVTEIKLPVHIKKVKKRYYQYYGTIDTGGLAAGTYRIEIDIKNATNSIIAATDAYFEIKE